MLSRRIPILLIAVCLNSAIVAAQEKPSIRGQTSPQIAVSMTEQTHRPLLVYFTAEQCVYCRKMEKSTWSHSEVAADVTRHFVALKVDGGAQPELASEMKVEGFPAIVVLSPEGKELARVTRFVSAEKMQEKLRPFIPQDGVAVRNVSSGTRSDSVLRRIQFWK